MASANGINPIEINAIDTLSIEPATFENHLSICIFNTSIYLCLGSQYVQFFNFVYLP
jgi:hypothetical protein